MQLTAANAEQAASLQHWLSEQGLSVRPVMRADEMGASEVIAVSAAASASLRAALAVLREWIIARRTTIKVDLPGEGSFEVTGPAEVDDLIALIESRRPHGE